jgi:hypothetical protein
VYERTQQDYTRHSTSTEVQSPLRNSPGYAYLGNSGTADAFTNAVSLRQPSLAVTREEFQIRPAELVTIRARVLPKGDERKPFLLQRQFNIEELRSSIPRSRISQISEDITPTPLRRSSRIRRSSAWQAGEHQKKAPLYCRTPTAGRLIRKSF